MHLAEHAQPLGQPLGYDPRWNQGCRRWRQPGFCGSEGVQIGRIQKAGQFRNLMRRDQISHGPDDPDALDRQRVGAPLCDEYLDGAGHHDQPSDPVA